MKILFNILTTLAVIALASADSNAICNGEIGNHASQTGGRDYISCVPSDNGEIVAQVQVCPNDQKFCPRTNGCLLSEECDIDKKHDSSSEDSSDSSSGSSSSEEVLKCNKKETKVWYELCPTLPGCLFCCEPKSDHDSDSKGDKCSHDLANCPFGVCKDFESQAADCRANAGAKCPGECCGESCALTPPCDTPTSDPLTCKNKCCSSGPAFKSGLFGSNFRGQVQTEICTPCPDDTFFCSFTGQCEQSNNLSYDNPCLLEIAFNCHCNFTNLRRDPENCGIAIGFCKDIGKDVKFPCGPDGLFSDEVNACVLPGQGPLYTTAQDACICGQPGYVATADGCSGIQCCPLVAPPPFSEGKTDPGCYAVGICPFPESQFFCETQKTCLAFGETCSDNSFNDNCCGYSPGETCYKYVYKCRGDIIPEETYDCQPGLFYCRNRPGVGGENCGFPEDGSDMPCDTAGTCEPTTTESTTATT